MVNELMRRNIIIKMWEKCISFVTRLKTVQIRQGQWFVISIFESGE